MRRTLLALSLTCRHVHRSLPLAECLLAVGHLRPLMRHRPEWEPLNQYFEQLSEKEQQTMLKWALKTRCDEFVLHRLATDDGPIREEQDFGVFFLLACKRGGMKVVDYLLD